MFLHPSLARQSLKGTLLEQYICLPCRNRYQTRELSQSARYPLRRAFHGQQRHAEPRPALPTRLHGDHRTVVPKQVRRSASSDSLASSSAINPPRQIPQAFQDLHHNLCTLRETAAGFFDLSRLQLAIRSLQNEEPTLRIALLGLGGDGAVAARRLARLLLCDALAQEEAWERRLLDNIADGKNVLLRYGQEGDIEPENPLVQSIPVPSAFLMRHNLEILIATLNAGDSRSLRHVQDFVDATLVPALTLPNSIRGVGFIRYPVHKSMIVAEGIAGAVQLGQFPLSNDDDGLISSTVDISLRQGASPDAPSEQVGGNPVDLDLADHALGLLRSSEGRGATFGDEWLNSRVPAVSEWLASDDSASGLKPTVADYISSTLQATEQSIDRVQTEQTEKAEGSAVPETKRSELQFAIRDWAAEAHKDLRINLTTALESPSWRRTAWFRLLWRIDDVSYSATDVLRHNWLSEAEQSLAFLSGRIRESGLAAEGDLRETGTGQKLLEDGMKAEMQTYDQVKDREDSVAEVMQMPRVLSQVQQDSGLNPLFDPPWPQTINMARQTLLHADVPILHRRAQGLVLSTLTTIGGTAALGGWLWVATSGVAIYEAGAIAALGLVWSLRRLQLLWGKERDGLAATARETGRKVLAEVEDNLRRIVREGGRWNVNPEDAKSWRRAKDAVQACRGALEKSR